VKVKAIKNIYEGTGKDMKMLVPKGTEGEVYDRYIWVQRRYIRVRFSNKIEMEFGDEHHPLISYKGFIKPIQCSFTK